MTEVKGDQFFVIDPAQPPAAGTKLSPVKLAIGDQDGNQIISPGSGDLVGGLRVTAVWVNDTITVDMGNGPITITGVTFYRDGGPAVFTPTDGTILDNAVLHSASYVTQSTQVTVATLGPPCFALGTQIMTPKGQRAVEDLRVGDGVLTRDHGVQTLRWVGNRTVSGQGKFAPIRFAAGTVGNNRDLLVSPQHRVLITGWRAEMLFGEEEVLVAAKHLVNGRTIVKQHVPTVSYFHLLFDAHEIVFSEGAPTESFYPGRGILAADRDLFLEIRALFPTLNAAAHGWRFAAPVITGAEAGALRMAGGDEYIQSALDVLE